MSFHTHLFVAAVACALSSGPVLSPGAVLAQSSKEPAVPAQPEAPQLDSKACNDRDRLKQGDTVETDVLAPRSEELLSDRLARTESVICPPPGLDPHIQAPAPNTGSDMPVIPPSANPAEPQTPTK